MPELQIAITIATTTPVSIGAGGSAGSIADKSIVRDGRGRPIIPGSQVKGKIRHAAETILASLGQPGQADFDDDESGPNPIRTLFGSPQQRSPLRFADLPALAEPEANQRLSEVRPSVSINRRRGVADDQRLLLQEAAWGGLQFHSGQAITGNLDDLGHAALLWAALRLTTRWGGATSRGFGWAEVTVTLYWDGAATPVTDAVLAQALRTLALRQEGQ